MATVKKSNKKKIIIPICIVLVVAIAVGSVFIVKSKNGGTQVNLASITTADIVESVSATGDVTAGASREYKVATVATCKEVFVKVGDKVKKGDKLATFDTQKLQKQVKSLSASYNDAKKSYDSAVKEQKIAKAKLDSVNSQIKKYEKEAQKYGQPETTTAKKTTTKRPSTTRPTTRPTTESTQRPSVPVPTQPTTESTTKEEVTYSKDLEGAITALQDLAKTITDLSDDIKTTNEMTRIVMETVAKELEKGILDPDVIAGKVGDAVAKAIKENVVDEKTLNVASETAVKMVETAVQNVDWASIGTAIVTNNNVQGSVAQLQLVSLYAQREILSVSASSTVVDAQKKMMDTTREALEILQESEKELEVGWEASMDGTITECTLEPGAETTALSAGLKLENTSTLVATISLGEYDVHKVKVGMPAVIKSAYGTYTGEVASIAPTATGGSEGSILNSVGSMAGISGLSSLTASGAGVKCTVTINEPDENIIIGFDADVEIDTGTYENVPVVPTESIVLTKEGSYVYKYNESDNTVSKTQITTGATSDIGYEVKEGLSVGDKIVKTPESNYEEDTFKVKVVEKEITTKAK